MGALRVMVVVSAFVLAGATSAAAAPAWLPAVDVGAPAAPGQDLDQPSVAANDAGDAVAVWGRFNGMAYFVQASWRAAGGPWSAPVDISEASAYAPYPVVAIDAAGDATVVYSPTDPDTQVQSVEALTRPAGGTWQAPHRLSAPGQAAENPRVAANIAGDVIAAWDANNGANWIVQAASRPAGGGWPADAANLSAAGGNGEYPDVAIDGTGAATVVWWRYAASAYVVQASTAPAGGPWQAPADLSSAGKLPPYPQVSANPAGDVVAGWPQSADGSTHRMQVALRPAGGAWQATPSDVSPLTEDARDPDVAIDSAGDAAALWQATSAGVPFRVDVASRPAGGSWSAPDTLGATDSDSQLGQIAFDGARGLTAVWTHHEGANYVVQSASRPAGGAWGPVSALSNTGVDAGPPALAADHNGDAVAVWARGSVVQAAVLDATPPVLGGLTAPHAATTADTSAFSVTATDLWSAIAGATWDFGDGTTASGLTVSHAYSSPGAYSVRVTATDQAGNSAVQTASVAVTAPQTPPTTTTTGVAPGRFDLHVSFVPQLLGSNVTPPKIVRTGQRTFACDPGTWNGVPQISQMAVIDGQLRTFPEVSWWRRGVRAFGKYRPGQPPPQPTWTQVGADRTYTLADADDGKVFICKVRVRSAAGTELEAASDPTALFISKVPFTLRPFHAAAYGNVRVRGIDVYQVTQPNWDTQIYGYPSGAAPLVCGGGTPTAFVLNAAGDHCDVVDDPQQARYDGVTLDRDKPTVAAVYVDADQQILRQDVPIYVTLREHKNGRIVSSLSRAITKVIVTPLPYVLEAERSNPADRVEFKVPAGWMADATHGGITLSADLRLGPSPADGELISQCIGDSGKASPPNPYAGADCTADDHYTLTGVTATSEMPPLSVRSVALICQPAAPPCPASRAAYGPSGPMLAGLKRDYPGGGNISVRGYEADINVRSAVTANLSDDACKPFRDKGWTIRDCRQALVDQAVRTWFSQDAVGRHADVLLGIHRYNDGNTTPDGTPIVEPGWSTTLVEDRSVLARLEAYLGIGRPGLKQPAILINDTGGRTTASHEFGHFLGFPHSDLVCGGNDSGQKGEPWPPDDRGRLEGVNAEIDPATGSLTSLQIDSPGLQLYDLMSYCGQTSLSPRNWNRALVSLKALYDAQRHTRAARQAAPAHTVAGSAFVTGVIGPDGAKITQIVSAAPGNLVPAADTASVLTVRAQDASGATLAQTGAAVATLHNHAEPVGVFIAPLPPGAATVKLVMAGSVVDQRVRSTPPAIRLVTPKPSARVNGALKVSWVASDPDHDPLTARVLYSANGRSRWQVAATGVTATHVTIPARTLPASRAGRVRVVVNDGFNDTSVTSGSIRVAGSPPDVTISRPGAAERVSPGSVIELAGDATDDRGATVSPSAMTWYLGPRRVARGPVARVKVPDGLAGRTVALVLQARDHLGRVTTVRRRLRVAGIPLQITGLLAPDVIAAGARTIPVTIATSAPARVRLGRRLTAVGPTPRTLRVPAPQRPRRGSLRAWITITAPDTTPRRIRQGILVSRR